jgi:hypothetical protein
MADLRYPSIRENDRHFTFMYDILDDEGLYASVQIVLLIGQGTI